MVSGKTALSGSCTEIPEDVGEAGLRKASAPELDSRAEALHLVTGWQPLREVGSADTAREPLSPTPELPGRGALLQSLLGHLGQAASGHGQVVLLHGEAGVGKTAVVRRLSELARPWAETLAGRCDPMTAPPPLGPLADIAPGLGQTVERVLGRVVRGDGSPSEVFRSLLEHLSHTEQAGGSTGGRTPTLLVFEDLHWADDATLDLLCYLGRRIGSAPALILATYRDDQVGRMHPLTVVLGNLAGCPAVHRYALAPLSKQGVAELAAGRRIDVDRLYDVTGGNPFFVTEVLAAPDHEIPVSVRQAVQGRLARLSDQAYGVVEAVAVIGSPASLTRIASMIPEPGSALTEALACGVLRTLGREVVFGSELVRMAVVEAIPDYRRVQLHGLALKAMTASASPDDLAQVAYHAEQAEDSATALTYSVAAARHASALNAHRQAVEQYDRALRHATCLSPVARGDLLANRAHECYLCGDIAKALASWQEALQLCRAQGDRLREGDNLRWISFVTWLSGDIGSALRIGRQAVSVLEALAPSPELGWAHVNMLQLAAHVHDVEAAAVQARSAIALGERFDEPGLGLSARFHEGLVRLIRTGEGWHDLEKVVREAVEGSLVEPAAFFVALLCLLATMNRDFERAESMTEQALALCTEHDLIVFADFVRGVAAVRMLHRGLWDQAADAAEAVLARPNVPSISRVLPLTVLGTVRARRGDPEVWPVLDEAMTLGERGGLLQSGQVWEARAEAAWLSGDDARAIAEASRGLAAAESHGGSTWLLGGLARWIHRAGGNLPDVPMIEVLAHETQGNWQEAARAWEHGGCEYDAALARLDGNVASLRRALATFTSLEARPAAARTRARLRALGVRQAASGPRAGTRTNPYLLTGRELEILTLLREGLSDAEIAARIYITRRTVSHHVSAILAKVGARSRHEAVRRFDEMLGSGL